MWSYKPHEILNPQWISKLTEIGLDVHEVLLFYCGPYYNPGVAHIDIKMSKAEPSIFGLNWVISGGIDTTMIWYELPPGETINIKYTPVGTKYSSYPYTSLLECDSALIQNDLTLVNVGAPHRIKSHESHRWCVSIRSSLQDKHEINSWNAIVNYMRDNNLLYERN
jgi:hypothetical protein